MAYFGYGWPKVLSLGHRSLGAVVQLFLDHEFLIVIAERGIQAWSGGQHRVRLGQAELGPGSEAGSAGEEEVHVSACWSPSKRSVAVLTSQQRLLVYSLQRLKSAALPLPAAPDTDGVASRQWDLSAVDVYVRGSVDLDSLGAPPSCLLSLDVRALVVGCEDGTLAAVNWGGKVREAGIDPLGAAWEEADDDAESLVALLQQADSLGACSDSAQRASIASPTAPPASIGNGAGAAVAAVPRRSAVVQLDYSIRGRALVLVLADGSVALCHNPLGPDLSQLSHLEFSHWVRPAAGGAGAPYATHASISVSAQLIAVGCSNGVVEMHALQPAAGAGAGGQLVRVLHLSDWGHQPWETGGVSALRWAPDARAIAVGYSRHGLVVWSPSGCRLLCTMRQPGTPRHAGAGCGSALLSPLPGGATPRGAGATPRFGAGADDLPAAPVLEGPVSAVAWGPGGYQLLVGEVAAGAGGAGMAGGAMPAARRGSLAEINLARPLAGHHRVAHMTNTRLGDELHVLQAHDRLLLITEPLSRQGVSSVTTALGGGAEASIAPGGSSDLLVHHATLPAAYLEANWPLVCAAVSGSGADLAVSGRRGIAVYSRRSERWRLFGDVRQERQVACAALGWLGEDVVACSTSGGGAWQLLVFPRTHLDFASLVASYDLSQQVPVAMDCCGRHVLVASEPLEILVLQLQKQTRIPAAGGLPEVTGSLIPLRELSLVNIGRPLLDIALVASRSDGHGSSEGAGPTQCVLLRLGGQMSVLDMDRGSEIMLADEIECFWLSDTLPALSSRGSSVAGSRSPSRTPSAQSLATFVGAGAGNGGAVGLQVTVPDDLPPCSSRSSPEPEVVEMPWWGYGPKGMELWFPSLLLAPLGTPVGGGSNHLPASPGSWHAAAVAAGADAGGGGAASNSGGGGGGGSTAIELEFDKEVYPIGISLADAAIVGVTQRLMRPHGSVRGGHEVSAPLPSSLPLPLFHPVPESQPVLPALLRRLLQRGALAEALALARRHECGPHFGRSLEWLLFTTLDMEPSQRDLLRGAVAVNKPDAGGFSSTLCKDGKSWHGHPSGNPAPVPVSRLLAAANELVLLFPRHAEVIVSVARKTDASRWPALFSAVGSPGALLEQLLEQGALRSAACQLVVVDRLEGVERAHDLALRLIRVTLRRAHYWLAAEILRFMIPPAELGMFVGGSGEVFLGSGGASASSEGGADGAGAGGSRSGASRYTCVPAGGYGSRAPSAEPAASGGSWLGWLWGGGGGPAAPAASNGAGGGGPTAPAAGAKPQAAAGDAAKAVPVAAAGAGSGAAREANGSALHHSSSGGGGARGRLSVAGAYRRSLANSGGRSNSGWDGLSSDGGLTPGVDACQLVADHGWLLLEQGKLALLAQLVHGMSFLPGGLPAMMASYRDAFMPDATDASAAEAAEVAAMVDGVLQQQSTAAAAALFRSPSPEELMQVLAVAMRELPVWESSSTEQDATLVLDLCRSMGCTRWALALGILLVDMDVLLPYAEASPAPWVRFCTLLKQDRSLFFLHEIVDAMAAAGAATPGSPLPSDWADEEEDGSGGGSDAAGDGGGVDAGDGEGGASATPHGDRINGAAAGAPPGQ